MGAARAGPDFGRSGVICRFARWWFENGAGVLQGRAGKGEKMNNSSLSPIVCEMNELFAK
jgi:hypothetical protein